MERLLRRRALGRKRRRGRVLHRFNPWEKWEEALLGTAPDCLPAPKLGRTRDAVGDKRRKLGTAYKWPRGR